MVLNLLVAALLVFFTQRLVTATEKMGDTQAKQAEILERQTGLLEGQTKLQEELSEIQKRLALAEEAPLLYLKRDLPAGPGAAELKNLGKYGVEVVEIRRHDSHPETPAQGGEALKFKVSGTLPAGIAPQETHPIDLGGFASEELNGPAWFEVLYRHGVGGELLSDLWEIPMNEHAFYRVPGWHARRVPGAEA